MTCLEPSSHYTPLCRRLIEEPGNNLRHLDSQASSPSPPHVDDLEPTALDKLQHRLAGNADDAPRIHHGNVSCGWLLAEARAQLLGDADAPEGVRRGVASLR